MIWWCPRHGVEVEEPSRSWGSIVNRERDWLLMYLIVGDLEVLRSAFTVVAVYGRNVNVIGVAASKLISRTKHKCLNKLFACFVLMT